MSTSILRSISLFLIPIMIFTCVCPSVSYGDVESTAVTTSDDDDDNETEQNILIGLGVAVVAVLFWLGFKSDLDWRRSKAEVPMTDEPDGPALVFDSSGGSSGPSLKSEDTVDFAGSVGVQVRF